VLPDLLRSEQKLPPGIQNVGARLAEMDARRARTLLGYTGMRRYSLRYGDSGHSGEMLVKAEYRYPDRKNFQIVSQTNCGFVHNEVFRRTMEAELQAAREDIRESTRILPSNYDLEVLGTEDLAGRESYVIRTRPKHRRRFLVDGKVWVDLADAAVARIEGEVFTGSFWVHNSHMVRCYRKIGPYWLVVSDKTEAKVRLAGEAHLDIEYFDYELRQA
jgi:hypothetical protein